MVYVVNVVIPEAPKIQESHHHGLEQSRWSHYSDFIKDQFLLVRYFSEIFLSFSLLLKIFHTENTSF